MFRVLTSFTTERDRRIAGLAGFLCLLASVAAVTLCSVAVAWIVTGVAMAILGFALGALFAHRRLRAHNSRLDTAVNHMPQGLLMFDAAGRLVLCNERYWQMYGLSPDVVTPGCTLRQLLDRRIGTGTFSMNDPDQYVADLRAAIAKGETVNKMVELTDGRTIAVSSRPMPGGGWVATHADITELKEAEKAVAAARAEAERAEREARAAHARLLDAVEVMPEAVVLCDADDRFVLWNRRYAEMYPHHVHIKPGMHFVDAVRMSLEAGLHPEAKGREEEWLAARLERHRQKHSRYEQQLKDGRWIRVDERRTSDGGSIGIRIDITELKQREASFRLLFEENPIPMWVYDRETLRFVAVNEAAIEQYGYSREQFLKMALVDIRQEKDWEEVGQNVKTMGTHYRSGERTWCHRKADGTEIDVAVFSRPLIYEGRPCSIGAIFDVTERKRAEDEVRRTREFLNTIVENVPALLLVKEPREQRYILINRQAEEFFGISRDDVIGKTAYDIFPSGQADVMGRRDKEVLRTGVPMLVEDNRVETAAMGARLVTSKRIAIRDDQGEAQYLLTVIEDVTDRKRQEDEVRRTREFLDTVVENVPATLIVRDARDGRYMLINRSGEELYGVTRDEMVGKTPYDIFPSDEAEAIVARDHEVMQSGQTMIVDGLSVHTPRKGVRLVRSKRLKIEGQDGSSQYVMSFVEDITEYKRAEQRIAHLAHHDALTDLPNRVSFTDRFAATLEQAARSNHSFAILCVDIDRFKEVNDVFGHSAGDALLREVSRRLCVAAEGAFLARLGGDEFTIIAEGPQPATAEALAERLLAGVAEDLDIAGHRLRIGLSVGIAIYPADGRDAGALLANADAALYRAKAEGRGTYRFFEPDMDKRLRERRALQHDLRSAVEKGELSLHYQPQALIGGDIIGFEALVRWQHPSIGTVPPHVFIPLAEENGLIMAIGEWVLREACREAASWPRHLQIAVNLSPIQFRHGDLAALVHSILLETGLNPSRLELEITEGVLIGEFSRAVSILRRLKALGVRIAMDDFGAGYSSLSYLQSFPFDTIKIDRAFISNVDCNPQSAAIVRAVIGLARGLSVPVVAEGVETRDQLAFLAREACDHVQGYLMGRPAPIDAYARIVGRPAGPGSMPAQAG
ncbi:MAG TPA: EAL domain-containing protein [Xanthobacteraceae bacterium]|nr:EAL domain-containing protein [Xanthobacteraceae bacterium]